MEIEKKQYIPTTFSELEKVNDEFLKCTIAVHSYDQIANGTKFRKEAIDKALPTLNYCPVIGYLKTDKSGEVDFSNHGIEYVIDDEGIKEVVRTIPFGVTIKDSQRWEKLTKDNGEYEEYLVVDCYLWGRYKDAIDVVKNNKCNQSMEVNINSAEYSSEGYYDISDFSYSALCILSEGCTPAFTLAKIRTSDKFSKDEFKVCYEDMISALDNFLNFEEGGENMDDNKEKGLEGKQDFELSFDEIRERIRNSVKTEDSYCWVVQTYSDHFIYEEETYKDDNFEVKFYKQGYSLEGNEVKLADDKVEVFARFVTQEEMNKLEQEKADYETNLNNLKAEFTDLKSELENAMEEYNLLSNEANELRQFKNEIEFEKHKCEVDSALEIYNELESVEGYSELVKDKYTCNIEELIKEIKVFAFDNNVTLNKKNTKKNFSKEGIKLPVVGRERDENITEAEKRYGLGIAKYIKK